MFLHVSVCAPGAGWVWSPVITSGRMGMSRGRYVLTVVGIPGGGYLQRDWYIQEVGIQGRGWVFPGVGIIQVEMVGMSRRGYPTGWAGYVWGYIQWLAIPGRGWVHPEGFVCPVGEVGYPSSLHIPTLHQHWHLVTATKTWIVDKCWTRSCWNAVLLSFDFMLKVALPHTNFLLIIINYFIL